MDIDCGIGFSTVVAIGYYGEVGPATNKLLFIFFSYRLADHLFW